MRGGKPFVGVCRTPLGRVLLDDSLPHQQRTGAAHRLVGELLRIIIVLHFHDIDHVVVDGDGAVADPGVLLVGSVHDIAVYPHKMAAGHGSVGSSHGIQVDALLVQVAVILAIGESRRISVRICMAVVEVKAQPVVFVKLGFHYIDIADGSVPDTMEAGPLHARNNRDGLTAQLDQVDGRCIAPIGVFRVCVGRGKHGVLEGNHVGFLSVGGDTDNQGSVADFRSREDHGSFRSLTHPKSRSIQSNAVKDLVVRGQGAEILTLQGNRLAGNHFSVISCFHTGDNRIRPPGGAAIARAAGNGTGNNRQ